MVYSAPVIPAATVTAVAPRGVVSNLPPKGSSLVTRPMVRSLFTVGVTAIR